jgi:hypothetical protein
MIRAIKVREPNVPSLEEQKQRVRWILGVLDNESEEPTKRKFKKQLAGSSTCRA